MKFGKYIVDRKIHIFLYSIMYVIILSLLFAFKTQFSLIVATTLIFGLFGIVILLFEYFRKKNFYSEFLDNLEQLDKKYLILETVDFPDFYEGDILYQALYEINKCMIERIKQYEININDFKDYIEMWIHEVKIPLSSLILMMHNNKDKFDNRAIEQTKRLDNYVEQVLYYVRSENAEKDYLINENNLDDIVSNIVMKNKDDLLEKKIELIVSEIDAIVLTDSKWLEFILNQILNNSIKYSRTNGEAQIQISVTIEENNKITLSVYDNGIGIPETDLGRVFEKSFTGQNGRTRAKSTGMGLYIAKKLCDKLGHGLTIESVEQEYTKVSLIFTKNTYFEVLKG